MERKINTKLKKKNDINKKKLVIILKIKEENIIDI